MKTTSILIMMVFVSLSVTSAGANQAIQSSAQGRLVAVGPSYFSAVKGLFSVKYYDESLPWGTRVMLRFGFARSQFEDGQLIKVSDWNDLQVKELTAVGAYRWSVQIEKELYSRGSSTQLTALDYVFEIHHPDGAITYKRGSDSAFGFYESAVPKQSNACDPWGENYCPLDTQIVVR